MKPILKQILISTVSAVAGGLIVFGSLKLLPANADEKRYSKQNSAVIYDDVLKNHDVVWNHFDTINEISKREDDHAVYFDIKVEDVNSTSINTKIENGYLTITGITEKKNGDGDVQKEEDGLSVQSFYKSSFNRTFPLPEHVDQNNMKINSEKDKIVLMFPKMKA